TSGDLFRVGQTPRALRLTQSNVGKLTDERLPWRDTRPLSAGRLGPAAVRAEGTGSGGQGWLKNHGRAESCPRAVDRVKRNRVAINFVWTLVAGFLVMFMQAGFAMVETGFTRAKNAAHTITMNFMVYGIAMLAYWAIGFALQAGGVGALGTLGGYDKLAHEFSLTIAGKEWGLFGGTGFFLTGVAYTAPVF